MVVRSPRASPRRRRRRRRRRARSASRGWRSRKSASSTRSTSSSTTRCASPSNCSCSRRRDTADPRLKRCSRGRGTARCPPAPARVKTRATIIHTTRVRPRFHIVTRCCPSFGGRVPHPKQNKNSARARDLSSIAASSLLIIFTRICARARARARKPSLEPTRFPGMNETMNTHS